MNVLLINPPAENLIRESLLTVVEDCTGVYPPLGLLYVATYAESLPGCRLRVLDCQAEHVSYKELTSIVQSFAPDVVGIQAMTFTMIDVLKVAETVKFVAPSAIVVVGGPHPTIYPRETVNLAPVDAVVYGEGEFVFRAILEKIREPLDNIPSVMTKESAKRTDLDVSLRYIPDLNALKMPSWHLLNLSRYYSPMARSRRVTTMMSSRGCPCRCTFCDRPQMGKIFRKRSAQNVFEEMSYCVKELGIGEIIFYDDTFSIDQARVLELCDILEHENLKVQWDIRARIDTMTPEIIRRLKRAGCVRIHYGVESGSVRIQKAIKKNLNLDQVKDVFLVTHKEGIETLGYFMIGLPSETLEDVNMSLDLLVNLKMDFANITVFTPYPGTEIYKQALADGVYKEDYWGEFARNPTPGFMPKFWNENFSDVQLWELLRLAYKRFYRRPGYILDRAFRIKSPTEFLRKAILGVKLWREVYR